MDEAKRTKKKKGGKCLPLQLPTLEQPRARQTLASAICDATCRQGRNELSHRHDDSSVSWRVAGPGGDTARVKLS